MTEMSRRFNSDDFGELCREALDEKMAAQGIALEEQALWADHDAQLADIGSVTIHTSQLPEQDQ